jgi:hypothetical protein
MVGRRMVTGAAAAKGVAGVAAAKSAASAADSALRHDSLSRRCGVLLLGAHKPASLISRVRSDVNTDNQLSSAAPQKGAPEGLPGDDTSTEVHTVFSSRDWDRYARAFHVMRACLSGS